MSFYEFILPDLGEGIHEAEIIEVKVKEGETVKEDQPIFEVETDKAVVEIPCPVSGVVEKLFVKAGDNVKVGTVMVTFSVAGAKASKPAQTGEREKQPAAAKGSSDNGRTGGGAVEQPEGRKVLSSIAAAVPAAGPVPAAPATRRLARELGVDLRMVPGSGPAGRVSNEDVRSFAAISLEGRMSSSALVEEPRAAARSAGGGKAAAAHSAPRSVPSLKDKYGGEGTRDDAAPLSARGIGAPAELPDFSKHGPIERIPLKSIRRKIAQNMTQSWTHIPHVTHFDEADVTDLEASRARHEQSVKEEGGRLTLTVLAIKAIASGLQKYPQFNASLDEATGEIIFKRYYNIGVAVATERGLIVPVIKDVDKKSVIELCRELGDIADKTRAGKVELDRLQGGTFTLTNIGAIGGTSMSPMINFPEAAILGMARAKLQPVVRNGNIEPRLILPLALSFDHRIADGAEAAYFVQHVVKRLEDPFTLLLEV